ncbi:MULTISPECIES: cupin-like domain-containing protein [unclassified Paraburkholderia]|uniref:cupin-like domain-containing protein n=1 Tax=unclassified Paraburkholderia TaxID=2615204 RepID=UPI002AB5FAC7|nr:MULTISPECIES: cupin-like domain-containing protein [unclassified Paraburkholderia]
MSVTSDGTVLADASRRLTSDDKILHASSTEFKSNFNLHPFKFNHVLHESGLFEIPRVAELAQLMLEKNGNARAINFKNSALDAKFSAMPHSKQLAEAFARVHENDSWIKLTQAHLFDADYAQVLDAITSELEDLSGFPLRSDMTLVTMTLLVSSPNISTPFHIDHETNFLFQLQGSKDVCLFPATDRELVPDQEVERYYAGNFEAARYRCQLQSRGTIFRLNPGEVVHHPSLAPHWVKNDNNVSVSISINYCMKSLEQRARVYQANYVLRKMGLKPLPPGVSPLRDKLKRKVISTLEHRDPKTFSEVVHWPVTRLKSPLDAVLRLVKR